jgi:ornithine lipid ester-linked acyl 2-hydroxylase
MNRQSQTSPDGGSRVIAVGFVSAGIIAILDGGCYRPPPVGIGVDPRRDGHIEEAPGGRGPEGARTLFYDPTEFAFAAVLEARWQEILADFARVAGDLHDWPERKLYDEGWQVFGLFNFPHGEPIAANVARAPFTAELVHRHVPNHGAVGFSVLRPMTRIRPHQGYPGSYLRCHLGLEVPRGDCAIRVGEETRGWEVGRVLVFDDRVDHEAWNLTAESRVVLLLDFVPGG